MKYLLFIIPLILIGQPPMEEMEPPPLEAEVHQIVHCPDLSEKEKTEIKDIIYDTRSEMIKIRAQIAQKKLDLAKEMEHDKPNLSKIKKVIGEISDLQAEAKFLYVKRMLKVREIVGPEKWEKMREKRREKIFRCMRKHHRFR